ncbi:unnamed protein product [Orchesella dallaii]|uniref:Anaphase-promoting complex subunit 4-like WD40 domain-containing protein n=1 Tax=Orchesella dallaii TaxID=48710 RepID=A0ABP1QE96_9HEXA
MPKMKVLETGQASEEVVIMSWSPKMDLLAIGNRKGSIQLHRLTWQKVWQVMLSNRGESIIPELMTWHPEGLFLIVSSGSLTYVIDVECGKVVHSHDVPVSITALTWCTSQYRHSMNDVLSTQSKQQSDYLRNDIKIQRLESNLSILFLGTSNGYVYAYTGGFLLGLCIKICEEGSNCHLLKIDASSSLEAFQFITDEDNGSDEVILSFSYFRNDYLPRIAPIIGPLGLKYILFLKNWAMIQSEMSSLNEHWGRLVDLYNNYMTFGGAKDLEVARVDYLELVLTGIVCVEMELFLGDGGREKEAKKNANAISTANASITEHLRTIKCSIVNLLTELNEIGGFLKQISGYEEANSLIVMLRKSCNYLFLAILHIQSLVHNFTEVYAHFMHMIMNTIHSFNVQEVPDFIEEDSDTDKVLEFLETVVDKDIFQFLMKNVSLGYPAIGDDDVVNNKPCPFGELNFPEKNALGVAAEEAETRDYLSFPVLIRDLLEKYHKDSEKHTVLMDFTEEEVNKFLCNIIPTMHKLTKVLLSIPVLCSVPFEADTHQIARLPKSIYLEPSSKPESEESIAGSNLVRKSFDAIVDHQNSKATLSCLWSCRKVLFFEIDFLDRRKINVKSVTLNFSRNIAAAELFSDSYITVVSHDTSKESQDSSKTIICQVQYRNPLNKSPYIDLNLLKSKCGGKSVVPPSAPVEVPTDISKPCAPFNNVHVDYALPIDGFSPLQLRVSGPRKVGSLLATNQRTVLLLEMETDLSETSYDDTAEASDSEDSKSNEGDDEDEED